MLVRLHSAQPETRRLDALESLPKRPSPSAATPGDGPCDLVHDPTRRGPCRNPAVSMAGWAVTRWWAPSRGGVEGPPWRNPMWGSGPASPSSCSDRAQPGAVPRSRGRRGSHAIERRFRLGATFRSGNESDPSQQRLTGLNPEHRFRTARERPIPTCRGTRRSPAAFEEFSRRTASGKCYNQPSTRALTIERLPASSASSGAVEEAADTRPARPASDVALASTPAPGPSGGRLRSGYSSPRPIRGGGDRSGSRPLCRPVPRSSGPPRAAPTAQ